KTATPSSVSRPPKYLTRAARNRRSDRPPAPTRTTLIRARVLADLFHRAPCTYSSYLLHSHENYSLLLLCSVEIIEKREMAVVPAHVGNRRHTPQEHSKYNTLHATKAR